jgi:rhodanese-related sulfurtransferase
MTTVVEIHAHFAARLDAETDVADVAADLQAGALPYTVIDARSERSWRNGHVPGALSVPASTITAEVAAALPEGLLVVYCWGPGCNGAHKAALELSRHGRRVKEMLGGYEYWVREGCPVEG